jgi:hypothetical protein
MEGKGVVGVDVSKARLDVAFRPSGKRLAVANASRGIARLVTMLKRTVPQCVLLEATAGMSSSWLSGFWQRSCQ